MSENFYLPMKKPHVISNSNIGSASVITHILTHGLSLSLYHPQPRIAALSGHSTHTPPPTSHCLALAFRDKDKDVKASCYTEKLCLERKKEKKKMSRPGGYGMLSMFKAMYILSGWVRPHYTLGTMKHDHNPVLSKAPPKGNAEPLSPQ